MKRRIGGLGVVLVGTAFGVSQSSSFEKHYYSSKRIFHLTTTVASMSIDYYLTLNEVNKIKNTIDIDLDEKLKKLQMEIEQITIKQLKTVDKKEIEICEGVVKNIRKEIDQTCELIVKKRESSSTTTSTSAPATAAKLMGNCHTRSAIKLRDMVCIV